MKNIKFTIPRETTVINIDDLIDILNEKYKNIKVYHRISVIREDEECIETVLSNIENLSLVDFDVIYPNELCKVTLKNGSIQTILKNEVDDVLIMTMDTLKENKDLVLLNSIEYYKGKLPQTIKVSTDIEVIIDLEKNINSKENLYKLKQLIGYIPEKMIDFSDKNFTTKHYKTTEIDSVVRFKFINETSNLNEYDACFYEKIKIRIPDNNIIKFSGYIFAKTDNGNCILLKEKNKISL